MLTIKHVDGVTTVTDASGLPIDDVIAIQWRLTAEGDTRAVLTVTNVEIDAELDEEGEWQEPILLTADDDAPQGVPEGARYAVCPVADYPGYLLLPDRFTGTHYTRWMKANEKRKGDPKIDAQNLLINFRMAVALYDIHIEGFDTRRFEANDYAVLSWLRRVNDAYLGEVLSRAA